MRGTAAAVLLLPILGLVQCGRPGAHAASLRFVPVRSYDVSRVIATTGTIEPEVGSEVRVGPRISGQLTHLYVRVGDLVKPGDLIAELDPGSLKARIRHAEAAVDSQRADEDYTHQVYDRKRRLYEKGLQSRDDVESALRDVRRTAALTRQAVADLDSARVDLSYARIVSPTAGVIASVSTPEGETVAASLAAPTFVTVVDINRLKLVAYIDEIDVGEARAGEGVTFTVEAYQGLVFEGRLRSVNPRPLIRDGVTNYVANVGLEPGFEGKLRPGMSATVVINTMRRRRFCAIPEAAILREADRTYVEVRRKSGVEKRRVQLGERVEGGVRVKEGLVEGDMIALQEAPGDSPHAGQ